MRNSQTILYEAVGLILVSLERLRNPGGSGIGLNTIEKFWLKESFDI